MFNMILVLYKLSQQMFTRSNLLFLSVSSPLVHPEELWGESGQLQRAAEETGDAAAECGKRDEGL